MAKKVNEFKVGKPTIVGSTTINHSARVNMGLNCSAYVLMDYIYRCVQNKKEVDVIETYRKTGFTPDQQEALLHDLVDKGFIYPENTPIPKITTMWESAFADIEVEFENAFWTKLIDGQRKVIWPGSKKRALSNYIKVRKGYSREFLTSQRNAYLEYLELERKGGFNRRIMMADKWLNPMNAYYEIDWRSEANKLLAGFKSAEKAKKETITEEQRKKQYEQDSDQQGDI